MNGTDPATTNRDDTFPSLISRAVERAALLAGTCRHPKRFWIFMALAAVLAAAIWMGAARARSSAASAEGALAEARVHPATERTKPTAAMRVEERLRRLRGLLAPDLVIASATGLDADGIAIAIDTADPDSLRARLHASAATRRLRETGQARGDDGMIRVTLLWRP